ncbi:MAG TPA: class I SAM-dependent methyltransferase [Gallionellaceae bacterium]|nr:class I SAM-dependent methyltransferase [Gallionellaceae bacterium]
MSQVFDSYARYYDLLYRDKDYAGESEYIAGHIRKQAPQAKRILELGCGTGTHAEHLARMGYTVHGVDMSEAMLARAEVRKANLPKDVAARLSFALGDVRTVRTGATYDTVISLFHVMSYQTRNVDLEATFKTASFHLQPGGLFLFDFWYGPAVLTQRPEVRVRCLEDGEIKVTRIAEPVMHVNENIVSVNYTMFIEVKATGQIEQIKENHQMRYLFLPELQCYYTDKFLECGSYAWMTDEQPNAEVWASIQSLVSA